MRTTLAPRKLLACISRCAPSNLELRQEPQWLFQDVLDICHMRLNSWRNRASHLHHRCAYLVTYVDLRFSKIRPDVVRRRGASFLVNFLEDILQCSTQKKTWRWYKRTPPNTAFLHHNALQMFSSQGSCKLYNLKKLYRPVQHILCTKVDTWRIHRTSKTRFFCFANFIIYCPMQY